MRAERVFLNPKEVAATGRIERNLHKGVIQVGEEGIDWGQQEINAFLVKRAIGAIPIDSEIPNRTVTVPLSLGLEGDLNEARIALEAEVGRINEEGGTLKREVIGGVYGEAGKHLFADIVKATLKLGDGTLQATDGIDEDAELILETLPDFYGDQIVSATFKGKGSAEGVLQVEGVLPARVDEFKVTDESGSDQLGLGFHYRCRNYSADESAAWAYEAEDLAPMDAAAIASSAVTHSSLGTNWTNVLALYRLPKVRGVGASVAGTGGVTPPLPTGVQKDDILIMYLETENQAVTAPTGWAQVHAPSITTGTPTRLTVLWKRAVAGETAPNVADPGDHVIARIIAVSGCIKTGNPWNVTGQGTEETSDTSVEFTSVTTTVDQCLVLQAISTGVDVSSTAHASAWANSKLQAVTERMDNWTAEGAGGGFGMATGVKAKAGATGITSATVATAAPKAQSTIALKPETGGNMLTHTGLYDVWARVSTSSSNRPWLRLLYDVGDLVAPVPNVAVQIPGNEGGSYLVPLGLVNLQRKALGEHRWGGVIQAQGAAGGENVTIDKLFFFNADECGGILKGSMSTDIGLGGMKVRDEFNQSAGVLAGVALPDGTGNWATSGSAKGDFEVASGAVVRTAKSDTELRFAKSPLTGGPYSRIALQMTFTWSALANQLISGLYSETFVKLLAAEAVTISGKLVMQLSSSFASSIVVPLEAGRAYKLTVLFYGGLKLAIFYLDDVEVGRGTSFGTVSNAWIGDFCSSANAVTRTYDDFSVWVPDADPVIFASRSALLTSDEMLREDAAGIGVGSVSYPGADLPRLPVSGAEGRPVEVAVKQSQGNFEDFADPSTTDAISFHLAYRPCWPGVPGE